MKNNLLKDISFYTFLSFFGLSFLTIFINQLVNINNLVELFKPAFKEVAWADISIWFIQFFTSLFILIAISLLLYFKLSKKITNNDRYIQSFSVLFIAYFLTSIINYIIIISFIKSMELGELFNFGKIITIIVFNIISSIIFILISFLKLKILPKKILVSISFLTNIIIFSLLASDKQSSASIAFLFFFFFAILFIFIYFLIYDLNLENLNHKLKTKNDIDSQKKEETSSTTTNNNIDDNEINNNINLKTKLEEYKNLYEQGLISKEEYEELRRKTLKL